MLLLSLLPLILLVLPIDFVSELRRSSPLVCFRNGDEFVLLLLAPICYYKKLYLFFWSLIKSEGSIAAIILPTLPVKVCLTFSLILIHFFESNFEV
jgi:hypothetical protein